MIAQIAVAILLCVICTVIGILGTLMVFWPEIGHPYHMRTNNEHSRTD